MLIQEREGRVKELFGRGSEIRVSNQSEKESDREMGDAWIGRESEKVILLVVVLFGEEDGF